jgi:hypothetical protein
MAEPREHTGSTLPAVLDAACGPRMFWFDRADPRALFIDKRREELIADTREGRGTSSLTPIR